VGPVVVSAAPRSVTWVSPYSNSSGAMLWPRMKPQSAQIQIATARFVISVRPGLYAPISVVGNATRRGPTQSSAPQKGHSDRETRSVTDSRMLSVRSVTRQDYTSGGC
jgi:hypothetical protein